MILLKRADSAMVYVNIDEVYDSVNIKVGFEPAARMGLGHWSRCEHEHLLVCRRGNVKVPDTDARQRSMIYAPRGKHSAKPDEAWRVIEATSSSSLGGGVDRGGVEFFCRNRRSGWAGWGHIGEATTAIYEPARQHERWGGPSPYHAPLVSQALGERVDVATLFAEDTIENRTRVLVQKYRQLDALLPARRTDPDEAESAPVEPTAEHTA